MALDSLAVRAGRLTPLNSLLISFRDSLVLEEYFRGMTHDKRINVKSVSKSLLSALVGIGIRDSLIKDVDQPIVELLPDVATFVQDSLKRTITVHHLLSMTSGLESTSSRNYGTWIASRDWVRFALEQPWECMPGTCMSYSTGNSHILSAILTRTSGVDTRTYFRQALFDSLGIYVPPWDRDPNGIYLGGNNMALRPVDMLTFGRLYLGGGSLHGRQLVPLDWIRKSWTPVGRSRWSGRRHGYHWWISTFGGEDVRYAWGYGGQFIFIVPRLQLVVVITSSIEEGRERGHNGAVYNLLSEHIIPAFLPET